ncbi:hypothetical protein C8R44DRAFT_823217 [Mycena epipterygia]|nr:hypothetical protein C8R44DRAFT_823217 [Mycena epipterygia]
MPFFLVVMLLHWDTHLQTYLTGMYTGNIGISLTNIPLSSAIFGTQIVDIHSLIMVRRLWVYLLWSCQQIGRASISQLRRV